MAAETAPTPGAIAKMFRNEKVAQPVLQITAMNHMPSAGDAPKRIKVMLSDGEHTAPGLMPSTVASLVSDGEVVLHQLVTLKEYIVNTIGGKTKACIVMSMDPVPLAEGAAAPELIGEPIKWDSEEANAAYASQAAEQQSVSPKGPPVSVPSPQTGNLSSRTTSSFSQPSQPYNPAGSSPLLANRCMPIDQLNPYSNRWQIKARVTRKTDLRTFSSAKGDGNFFSMDLSDDSAEIKATAWREVADRLYAMIEVGQTYLISRGQLKVANKKFSTLNNSYELTLNYDTQLQLCADEPITAPKIHYNFCPVGNVAQRSKDAVVDVIGVVSNVSTATTLTSKNTGKELVKRTMTIADDSGKSIDITLWGQGASTFPDLDASATEVVAFKGLRVTDWNEKSLGGSFSTTFEINPEQDATARIKAWWEAGGAGSAVSLSVDTRGGGADRAADDKSRLTTSEFRDRGEALMASSEPLFANVRGYVTKILDKSGGQGGDERPLWYASCPKCSKKVVGDEMSGHNCENCGWSGTECSYRYILPMQVMDAEGVSYMTAFNDQAVPLLHMPADELKRLKDSSQSKYEAVLARAVFKHFVVRVRGRMDTYQGTSRLKQNLLRATPVNYAEEGKLLLADIAKYDLTSSA